MLFPLFDTSDFPARWHCGNWSALHGWTHIAADLAIFGAYAAIPVSIAFYIFKRRDVRLPTLWWLFAAFIASCGLGHLVEATIFWYPWYRFSAVIKVTTAVFSWATVVVLLRHWPMLLSLPGIHQINRQLLDEVKQRKKIEADRERFFDLSLDMLCMANFEGYFVRLNPAFELTLGHSIAEMMSTRFLEFVHPDDVESTLEQLNKIRCGGNSFDFENRYRAKDGSWRRLMWKASPDVNARLIYATARDVTEERAVQESLQRRERHARLHAEVVSGLAREQSLQDKLQQSCQAIVGHLEASCAVLWTSDMAEQVLELQATANAGVNLPPIYRRIPMGTLKIGEIAQNRSPFLSNHLLEEIAGGEYAWCAEEGLIACAICPLMAGDKLKGVLAVFARETLRDSELRSVEIIAHELSVTISRHRTLEALSKSEAEAQRLALVAAQSKSAVVITDKNGHVDWVNDGFVRLTGYNLEEVRGKRPGTLLQGEKSDRAVIAKMREAIRARRPFEAELINYFKGGAEYWTRIEGQPLFDDKGDLTSFMAIETDITERKLAEEKLRVSEEYNRSIVESTTDCLEIVDLGGVLTHTSDSRAVRFPTQQHSCSWLDRWMEADRSTADAALRCAMQGEARRFSGRSRLPNGTVGFWDVVVSPIRDAEGRPEQLLSVSRDITQQRKNEEELLHLNATLEERVEKRAVELAESQARFKGAMHSSAVGMALVLPDGRWIEVNESLCRSLGYSAAELVATDFQSVTHPDDLAPDLEQARRVLAGEIATYQMEKRYLRKDGSIMWGHLSVSLTRDGAGQPLYFISQVQDFTERKRAELELKQSEERFRLMVEHVQDYAIFMLDLEGRVASWNHGAERTTGYAAGEILGQHFAIFHAQGEVEAEPLLAKALEKGYVKDEGWRVRRDGTTLWAEVVLTAINDSTGVLRGYAHVTHDLTKRREAEAQSQRSQRLEAIGNIASGIAHDLNNALGPIIMGLGVLRTSYPQEDSLLEAFESCGRRAADMVRQLLTFARGAEGERENIQPQSLLKEMRQIISGILPKNIQTTFKWSNDLRLIYGDSTQVHQILLNLCVNARDAMPDGGALTVEASNIDVDEVFASSQEGAKPGPYVRFDVRDTGEGIPPAIMDRIFEPFFTTKSPDKGTGLGLSTVIGIVKGHGGFLRLYSAPGEGSTFSIFLPVSTVEPTLDDAKCEASTYHGGGQLILVVDDEKPIRDVFRLVLHRLGFKVLTATDGADALIRVAESRKELHAVVTDMHMPHMDGLALVRAIRRILPELPVVVASGRLEENERKELNRLNVDGLLHKPFTEKEFSSVLQRALQKEQSALPQELTAMF